MVTLNDFDGSKTPSVKDSSATSSKQAKALNERKKKAVEMSANQREISVAEFFEKNRHLLGFDNKRKALLTTVKEAVDNSLDACEEAGILPEIHVELIEMGNNRFRIVIEDNGPGIVKKQIPKIFAKLLYGSKFHSLKQSRGQQGIGISASVMYGQLTTGRPAKITSKIHPDDPAYYYELKLNTTKNEPEIVTEKEKPWTGKNHGTRIEIDLEASYQKGSQSVDEYLKETAIINPHVTMIYTNPKAEQFIFPRAVETLPKIPEEIKPHPYGVELGMLIKMLQWTTAKTIKQFLREDFSRVGAKAADEILENSKILPKTKPKKISRDMAEDLIKGIRDTKLMMPSSDCISPIGEENLIKGLKKEINAEFYAACTRPPAVYRGNPFIIEAAIAYGGNQPGDKAIKIMRFANKVPLLFQQGACASTESVGKTNWRPYGLQQSGTNVPTGPATVLIHMASGWVPFTSEAKEALAHYPEISKEIRLAIQEVGRQLSKYTAKKKRVKDELKKRSFIEKYIPHVASSLKDILGFSEAESGAVEEELKKLLEKDRGAIKAVEFDAKANEEFDETIANFGKEDPTEPSDQTAEDEDKK